MSSSEPAAEPIRVGRAYRPAVWAAVCALGIAGWLASFAGADHARVWRALLINFNFFTPLAAGLVTWSAILLASRGLWQLGIERPVMSGLFFAVPSVVALVALWIGSPAWAPWYGARGLSQGWWLNNTFVFVRDLVVLVGFWIVAAAYTCRRREGRGTRLAGFLILAYGVTFTVLGFDLVMALDPRWYSTLFGGYFFVSGIYAALVLWTLDTARKPDSTGDELHDLGKLVVAFSLLTTYLMYAQLLVIWYENMPRETGFLVPRMNFYPWAGVSIALLATVYLGPLAILLTIWSKRSRWFLGGFAALLLVGLWVERWWQVAPTFSPNLTFGLAEAAMVVAFIGAFGLATTLFERRTPPDAFGRLVGE